MIRDDADDIEQRAARAARQLQPWDDIAEPRPTARDIAAERSEIACIEESLAEISAELGPMALRRDPGLARWQAMARDAERDAERDLRFARRVLAELLERTE